MSMQHTEDYIDHLKYYGLSARIKRVSDALQADARRVYAYLGFDIEPNWHLVFLSLKEESLSVTELAKRLQFSHPAIVKIIQKMKERGYVKSVADKTDSRKQLLSLTAKSRKALPAFEREWNNIQQVMNEASTDAFMDSLRVFENHFREASLLERMKQRHGESSALAFEIHPADLDDVPTISALYQQATAYMKSKGQVYWPIFPATMIAQEIKEQRLWKMTAGNDIACIWSFAFNDPDIWEEKDNDPAIYLHKITTAPAFRGNNLVGRLVEWTTQYARENGKDFIRMDTVGNNTGLIAHYQKHGFTHLGAKALKNIEDLPAHYADGDAQLFEISL